MAHLPALHLKVASTGAVVLTELADPLQPAFEAVPHQRQWVDLQAARAAGVGQSAGFPKSSVWWESASTAVFGPERAFQQPPSNGVFARDPNGFFPGEPGPRIEQDPVTRRPMPPVYPVAPMPRQPFKYLRRVFPYANMPQLTTSEVGNWAYTYPPMRNAATADSFKHGKFDVAKSTNGPMNVEWFSCQAGPGGAQFTIEPLGVGWDGEGMPAPPSYEQVFGPSDPNPVNQQRVDADVLYVAVVAIDMLAASEQVRLCGSILYYDNSIVPTHHDDAVQAMMADCPYYNIGPEVSHAPGTVGFKRNQEALFPPEA